jgi:ribosome modulation factor
MGHRITWERMGAKAAQDGIAESDCPYRRASSARTCWLRGFRDETAKMEAWLDDFEPGWREELQRLSPS